VKNNRIKKMILGAFVAVFLMSGVLATRAEAQGRFYRRPRAVIVYRPFNPFWHRRYDPFWGPSTYTVVDPVAARSEEGFRDGRSQGKKDAKKGLEADPTRNKEYNKSNSLAYRQAFVHGYEQGYHAELN